MKGKGRLLTFWIPDKQEEPGSLWKDEGWNQPLEEHGKKLLLEAHSTNIAVDKGSVKMAWERGNAYLYT